MKNQLPLGSKLGVVLVDMYFKCSRVEKAPKIFEISGKSVDPCVVDILARAGRLEEAGGLSEAKPMEPNEVVWRSLLSACKNHGSTGIGHSGAKNLLQISSYDFSSYILIFIM